MSKLVTMLQDVYPFGCLGDVVTLAEDEIKKLEKIAKARKQTLFEDFHKAVDQVDGAAKAAADKQAKADAAAKKAQEDQAAKEAKVQADADAKAAADKKAADAASTTANNGAATASK